MWPGLVCPECPPTSLAGAEARLLLEVARAAWLPASPAASGAESQSPAPAPGNQYLCRHWPVSGQAVSGSGQGWTESVEWSEGRGKHPVRAVIQGPCSVSSASEGKEEVTS